MEISGYIAAILIGLSLGLIGGGGSTLTLPVLIYLFGINTIPATGYSLFVVGVTSAFGAATHFHLKNINIKAAFTFFIPSLLAVFSVRKFVLPNLPDLLFHVGNYPVTKEQFILWFFSIIMLVAGILMIAGVCVHCDEDPSIEKPIRYQFMILGGLAIGAITGFIGAGGGFLIIPTLVLYGGLSMRKAVGTSLLIIAVNSLTGFIGDLTYLKNIDWKLIFIFTALAIAGMFIGSRLQHKFSDTKLRKTFGVLTTCVALLILIKEYL